jgi:hypothetical protein
MNSYPKAFMVLHIHMHVRIYSGMIGKYISANSSRPYSRDLGRASVKASREITLNKGRQQIMQLAQPLRLANLVEAVSDVHIVYK